MKRIAGVTASLASALGLGSSLILLVDYSRSATSLCSTAGGCQEVKASALAFVAGIPTPALGVAFFALMLLARQFAPARHTRALAACGALVGFFLLAVQAFSIGAFCRFCVLADLSAIALFASLLGRMPREPARPLASLGSALAAGLLYLAVAAGGSSPTASAGDQDITAASEGRATIVEFVDFQCPACRALHAQLSAAIEAYADKVRIVRQHLPLPQHGHARAAAQAYCCAEEAGLAEPMADRLFTAADLRPAACEDMAVELGAERARFRECMRSDRPSARIAEDEQAARDLEVRALPTLFIGTQRFQGVPEADALARSIEAAVAAI